MSITKFNTTYNHVCYETMYTQYHPVRQTKMPANVHYVPICQTYCKRHLCNLCYRFLLLLFLADSDCCSRQCLGAMRPFSMSITDNNQMEVIRLERPYRCMAWCCFCCLQEMEVQSPPGTTIGYITQE